MTLSYRSVAVGLTIGVIAGRAGGALAQSSSATRGSGNQHQRTSNSQMRRQWSAWAGPGDASGWQASWSGDVPDVIATAVAHYLGISPASLTGRLQSQTLAQIARAHGKPVAALQNAIASAVKMELDVSQALTGAEKSALAAAVAGHIGLALTARCPNGPAAGWWLYLKIPHEQFVPVCMSPPSETHRTT
jgi:hypothetical protein